MMTLDSDDGWVFDGYPLSWVAPMIMCLCVRRRRVHNNLSLAFVPLNHRVLRGLVVHLGTSRSSVTCTSRSAYPCG